MSNLFDKLFVRAEQHISEDNLIALLDGELPTAVSRKLNRHLERCWDCRARYEQMQAGIVYVVSYRKHIAASFMPPPPGGRDRFLVKLEEALGKPKISWGSYFRPTFLKQMNPALATIAVVVVATLLVFLIWDRNATSVSAGELLQRAAVWDLRPSPESRAGVVFQKVQIHTKKTTVERTLYRDVAGHKKPRRPDQDGANAEINRMLELAGIDAQQPLSAGSYRDWHDRLANKADGVQRPSRNILTLSTATDSGEVKEASLSVRSTDFHPVARRAVLRDSEEIEIAEINYDVLSWDAVNVAQLFEPEPSPVLAGLAPPAPKELPLKVPSVAALDEAELRARLALNRANADTGEQIAIVQSQASVQVSGVVENEARRKLLEDELHGIPLVTTSLQSFEELAQKRSATPDTSSNRSAPGAKVITEYAVVQKSPLETYLASRGVSAEDAARMGQQLFDAAFTIQKETQALRVLDERFPAAGRTRLDATGTALLSELLSKHLNTLRDAITAEQVLSASNGLNEERNAPAEPQPGSSNLVTAAPLDDLQDAAERNRELCDELLNAAEPGQSGPARTGHDQAQRPIAEVLSDMNRVVARLRAIAAELL